MQFFFFIHRFQRIKYEIDPEYLFSPVSGEGKHERRVVETYFKVNYTHRFNVERVTRPGMIEYYFAYIFIYLYCIHTHQTVRCY